MGNKATNVFQIYQVGGAVRNAALGLPVHERDWVVVGATPEMLIAQGYKPVGRDFPVFLHPETHEEYALARTERKSGSGHTGFICDFEPSTTLEEDLIRRDLTINAMAQASNGQIIDPYGGGRDLEARVLRHVSPAFVEDPLRVLRVARFAAVLAPFDFKLAPETLALMRSMVAKGELNTLTPERVWKEVMKAMAAPAPDKFFEILESCDALAVLFPEIREWQRLRQDLRCSAAAPLLDPSERWAAGVSALEPSVLETLHHRLHVPLAISGLARALSHARRTPLTVEGLLGWLNEADPRRAPERFTSVRTCLTVLGYDIFSEVLEKIGRDYAQTITLTPEEQSWPGSKIQLELVNRKRALIAGALGCR